MCFGHKNNSSWPHLSQFDKFFQISLMFPEILSLTLVKRQIFHWCSHREKKTLWLDYFCWGSFKVWGFFLNYPKRLATNNALILVLVALTSIGSCSAADAWAVWAADVVFRKCQTAGSAVIEPPSPVLPVPFTPWRSMPISPKQIKPCDHTSGLIGKFGCVIGKLKKRSVCMQSAFLLCTQI